MRDNVSIRASLQQRGELLQIQLCRYFRKVSIRASLQQRGEHLAFGDRAQGGQVSIRASLQQRGERRLHWRSGADPDPEARFNPRLTSAARRTSAKTPNVAALNSFQSAPHFSSEANRFGLPLQGFLRVSIRASLQQRGELIDNCVNILNATFQSAPHFSSEANSVATRRSNREYQFQSAPHFSSEANMHDDLKACRGIAVSIRASLQQRGEPRSISFVCCRSRFNPRLTSAARRTRSAERLISELPVSIRASLQQRGEPFRDSNVLVDALFQSAPHFSSEANTVPLSAAQIIAFQSAPHFSSEANPRRGRDRPGVLRFNPRLTSAARRTRKSPFKSSQKDCVSIRASLQQRGELSPLLFNVNYIFIDDN